MATKGQDKGKGTAKDQPKGMGAYLINEQGEEIPITDEMIDEAMKDIKLQSIGAHTGYTKAITDEMLEEMKQRKGEEKGKRKE